MPMLIGITVANRLFLGLDFAQGSSSSGSIRGDVFTKGTNGKPAVLPWARLVLRGPITKQTESDTHGASAIDRLPPATYEIEANAPGLYEALAVEVRTRTSAVAPVEMNVATVTSTKSLQLTRLKAMDWATNREVRHA